MTIGCAGVRELAADSNLPITSDKGARENIDVLALLEVEMRDELCRNNTFVIYHYIPESNSVDLGEQWSAMRHLYSLFRNLLAARAVDYLQLRYKDEAT